MPIKTFRKCIEYDKSLRTRNFYLTYHPLSTMANPIRGYLTYNG